MREVEWDLGLFIYVLEADHVLLVVFCLRASMFHFLFLLAAFMFVGSFCVLVSMFADRFCVSLWQFLFLLTVSRREVGSLFLLEVSVFY